MLNSRLLAEQKDKLDALKKAITLVRNTHASKVLDYSEAAGLLDISENYSYALGLLDDYDRGSLKISHTTPGARFRLSYERVTRAVAEIRSRIGAGGLFGLEKDRSLRSSVAAIYQTFGGRDLYPSAEEKAAALLYFMVKNHSFVDGNKRIAAAVFLWFLEKNRMLYRPDGSKRLADNALVALTLMIAESRPAERVAITALVVNLINNRN
ncbi:MAG: filamentation induced by cAMP protein fic [Elusimicrobia bacterium]|nr:MAG: filamentation induced by cAMP protein fic [Elusimicrobiota bacterium]KAF0154524.1 MAG: filamentation induced by cAMP protein fic [Elusimicrobiota bacterium]